jgi:hypothetical protein
MVSNGCQIEANGGPSGSDGYASGSEAGAGECLRAPERRCSGGVGLQEARDDGEAVAVPWGAAALDCRERERVALVLRRSIRSDKRNQSR